MRFEGKIALVTGGARGIGKACCLQLAREGATVFVSSLNREGCERVCDEIEKAGFSGRGIPAPLDVRSVSDIRRLFGEVKKEQGRLDVLVSSAGISMLKPVEEIEEQDWDDVLDTNLKGNFFVMQAALQLMKEHKYGKIVCLSSIAGRVGGLVVGANYAASKAGIACLAKSLAKSGAPFGINVNAVSPGVIVTDQSVPVRAMASMNAEATIPLKRYGTPEETAETILFLCSDQASFITGANIDINGGQVMY